MKYGLILLLGFSLVCRVLSQDVVDSLWVTTHYHKIERRIPMRDGVKLFTAIYIPNEINSGSQHPILLTRTPYSCVPYGESAFCPGLWNSYWSSYAQRGYIIVIQDVRGKWMSEGDFVDIRPYNPQKKGQDIDESSDAYDAIDWLVKNVPGNNGKVGVFGISYPGFYTTMAALSGHPALKAVSPQAPVTDWFHGDDFHHNGAFFLMDCFSFYTKGFGYPHRGPTALPRVQALKLPNADNYATFLQIGPLKNFTRLTGDSLSFWKQLMQHPNEDDWWRARDPRNFVKGLRPAVLVVGGLFDAEDCFGAWNLYKAIERENSATHCNKLVMGPWYHGEWAANDGSRLGHVCFGSNTAAWYQAHVEVPFFDYYLLGKGSLDSLAEATVFFTGENQWKQFPVWPPRTSEPAELYLQPGGGLSWSKPAGTNSFSEYLSDPAHPVPYTEDVHYVRTRDYMTDDQRFASRRADVLSFQTPVLTDNLTLTGPLQADLLVSISGTDADFVVKLIDVFPDDFSYPGAPGPNRTRDAGGPYPMAGYEMLVRGDIIRGRFRNSFSIPEAFTPGKVERVRFTLPDVAHTFLKGHRVMVQVQSTWFPLADRNPQQFIDIYQAGEEDFKKSVVHVYHDEQNSSGIILPVLK